MAYFPGKVLKRFDLPNGHSIELVARHDGDFVFHERPFPYGTRDGYAAYLFSSRPYISAETAEAAARAMFKF